MAFPLVCLLNEKPGILIMCNHHINGINAWTQAHKHTCMHACTCTCTRTHTQIQMLYNVFSMREQYFYVKRRLQVIIVHILCILTSQNIFFSYTVLSRIMAPIVSNYGRSCINTWSHLVARGRALQQN